MRSAFINKITEMARKNPDIYFLTGDLGFSVVEDFQKEFPDRFLNVGIAEQNLMGVAAGLALSGKTVFVYSIASFATMRCFEQIRNDICYHNLKVRIIGVGSGFSYSSYGLTHQTECDISIMRSIPNMKVIAPGDPLEVEKAMEESENINGPMYIRLGKKGEPILNDKNFNFSIGKGIIMKEGNSVTLISSGNTLELVKKISDRLESEGISNRLISMHTIKPLDKELILDSLKKTKFIFTVEEHSVIGGLGSAVAEVIAESDLNKGIIFKRIGINDKFCIIAGDQNYIRDECDMSEEKIISKIKSIVKPN
jgi:transketolase